MKDLETCRKEIDEIDQQMIQLFEKRMKVAQDVVAYKLENNLEIFQPEREKQVIEKNVKRIETKELEDYARLFVRDVMNISKSYQATFVPSSQSLDLQEPEDKDIVVGFQGTLGSFSCNALDNYFSKETKRKHYEYFEDVFKALQADEIDYGIVPLENSSTGAIHDNYDLIRDYGFYIVGEQSLSISQHLLGIKGSSLEDLTDVYSHPQGILQTSDFLSQYPHIKTHNYTNTALAAKYVSKMQDQHMGAIASKEAAALYQLDILQENIQNTKSNATRFIVFSKKLLVEKEAACVSIVFTLNHEAGTLYQVMKIINDHQINMLRIESRPLKDSPWEYYFYVDFEGNLSQTNILLALEDMKAHTNTLRVLGNYVKHGDEK